MSEFAKGPADSCRALVEKPWVNIINRKIILMATSTITNESLFANGLFQNVCILYKLFDSMGYAPILVVNTKPTSLTSVPPMIQHMRMMTVDEIVRAPKMLIHMYLEIGMSIDPSLRRIFRIGGARVVKLYLGNILNIDIETPMFYTGMNFSHHIIDEIDEIWVSPHYKQHEEYAAVLNHVEPNSNTSMKIAPYVWDPCILTLDGTRRLQWRARLQTEKETFIILEPNISFQKCSLIPILIVERNYRQNKRPMHVLVGNGDKLLNNPFFLQTILPTLELAKDSMITFSGRHDIPSIMREYPHATAICHQWNNQYNYMTLEYLYSGFPVIHNAQDWSDVGYYYKGNDSSEGEAALTRALVQHQTSLERYKSGAESVKWRHSPYNPDVQKAWYELLL